MASWMLCDRASRHHEENNFRCILGCEYNDELTHYLECPVLWALTPPGNMFDNQSPWERPRLVSPSPHKTRLLQVAVGSTIV